MPKKTNNNYYFNEYYNFNSQYNKLVSDLKN